MLLNILSKGVYQFTTAKYEVSYCILHRPRKQDRIHLIAIGRVANVRHSAGK